MFGRTYEEVKASLTMRAVANDTKGVFTSTAPHKKLSDLVFVYQFELSPGLNVVITNDILKMWGVSKSQLEKDAAEIAPNNREMKFGLFAGFPGSKGMVLVTNETGVDGAGVVGYPDFFEKAAKKMGGSFYLIPSSVHEVILVKDDGRITARVLDDMIADVNREQVEPEERLSWCSYHYSTRTKTFEKGFEYDRRRRR